MFVIFKIIIPILYAFIIFPIFISIDIFFDGDTKKIYFSFYLYRFIRIFSGYIQNIEEGFAIHYSKKKAIILPYKSLLSLKASIKPIRDYHIFYANTLLEIGIKDKPLLPLTCAFGINFFNSFINWFLLNKKPYLILDNKIKIFEERDICNLYSKFKVVFNLLMIILSIIKILLEKLFYASKKRKQNKFSD